MKVDVGANGLPVPAGLGAFEVPTEFASAIERLDGPQLKRSVELMGQCVQVGVQHTRFEPGLDVALLGIYRLISCCELRGYWSVMPIGFTLCFEVF